MLVLVGRLNAGHNLDACELPRPCSLVKEGARAGAPDLVAVGEGDEDFPDLFLVEVRTGPCPPSRDYLALDQEPPLIEREVLGLLSGGKVLRFKERGSGDRLGVLRRQLVEPE